jgi:hypothetical protein
MRFGIAWKKFPAILRPALSASVCEAAFGKKKLSLVTGGIGAISISSGGLLC